MNCGLNSESKPWINDSTIHPRRSGVSAFGFGGINVHIALEEYSKLSKNNYRLHQPFKTVLLTANTPEELLVSCQGALKKIESSGITAFNELVNNAPVGTIPPNQARLGFVVSDSSECVEFLKIAIQNLNNSKQSWEHPRGIFYRPNGLDTSGQVVALFSGQGSQYIGMGREAVNAFPPLLESFTQIDQLFEKQHQLLKRIV